MTRQRAAPTPCCACAKRIWKSTCPAAKAKKRKTLHLKKRVKTPFKRLEEESRKPASERRPPEFGSDKDFQLQQALNQLKNKPVLVSKTLVERKEEIKDN